MNKKLLLLIVVCAMSVFVQAQEEENTNETLFNAWSLDLSVGLNKPLRPVASGFYTSTPSLFGANIGARYMFNEYAGLRGSLSYNSFTNPDGARNFESSIYSVTLEGVINGGNVLNFNNWTNRLGFLVHGGVGYSRLTSELPVKRDFGAADQMLTLTAGISPQYKISEKVALFVDASIATTVRQNLTFDGGRTAPVTRGFDGYFMTFSVGANIYLGKKDKHADWFSKNSLQEEKINELEERIAKLETDLIDTDQDGVADYLDREQNTVSGVAVNTKGYAVDTNANGIPDELEPTLDARFATKKDLEGLAKPSNQDVIGKLLNSGYVNVYFQFGSTQPELYSLEAINYLINYLSENPSKNAELIGYADEVGNEASNLRLSEKRAQKVKEILVAAGINESRLSVTGSGEDTATTKEARQLVRRVTFKLK